MNINQHSFSVNEVSPDIVDMLSERQEIVVYHNPCASSGWNPYPSSDEFTPWSASSKYSVNHDGHHE